MHSCQLLCYNFIMFDDHLPFVVFTRLQVIAASVIIASSFFLALRIQKIASNRPTIIKISALLPVVFLFIQWFFLSVDVPDWDDFEAILQYLALPEAERFSHLFDMHNEHRIVSVRLLADVITRLVGHFSFCTFMLIGNGILAIFALLWYRVTTKIGCPWIGVAACWLFTSLLHWENLFQALCSVQNVTVMLLAFMSILLCVHTTPLKLTASVICAITASFTSGSGIFIWPLLILTLILEPAFNSGDWRSAFSSLRSHIYSRQLVANIAFVALIGGACAAIYFSLPYNRAAHIVRDFAKPGDILLGKTTIMGYQVELTPTFIAKHLMWALCYSVRCLGGIIPFSLPALILGLFVAVGLIYIILNLPQMKHPALFAFLLFNIICIISCAIFRAASFDLVVAPRYRIVCMSTFLCVLLLLLTHIKALNPLSHAPHIISSIFLPTSIALVLSFALFAGPCLYIRQQGLRNNILTWPKHIEGLHFSSDRLDFADEILKKCIKNKTYDPAYLLKENENRPTELINIPL